MSKRNVRIAIRDTTDSHNVGFFDNKAGIRYNSANLTQFLKGACSVLVLTYHSKKMIAQSGQKLAFRFKDKDFWLNINSVKKTGYKIELTAYSLSLEANKEKRGPHKPANAMSIKQYIDYYDPEHSFEIGINEVADKSIKLEWSGTDTILARLYSVANSFGAELEFVTELNNDYSLKRHVVNIYREGNLGKDKTGMPVRVGEKLKVINYSDNMDDFYTGIRRTGKDGLTIAGLNKKIYDDKGNLLFYSSGDTLYAPQARDKYPSIARKTNDGYIVNEDSETEHASKEALFGYMLSELKKHCELKVDYEVEGAVDGNIGDRKTLIDGRHFDPPLYVQARISEQTEALLETSDVKTTLSNYVRKSSQIANELLQRVEQLTLEATPYTIKLATNNGIVFKNNQGQSTIYPTLKRGQKPVECMWKWLVDDQGFGTSPTFEVKAAGMSSKLVLTAIALVDNKEVAREQVTFTNVNDGAKGSDGKSITVTKAEKQADGVRVTFSDNKSIVVPKGDKGDKGEPGPQGKDGNFKGTVGGRNYIRHYDFDGLLPFSFAGSEWTFERIQDPVAKSGWALKATNVKGSDGGIHKPLVDLRGEEWQGKQMVWSVDVKSNRTDINLYNIGFEAGGNITSGVKLSDKWQRISKAFIVKFDTYWSFVIYGFGWNAGDVIYIRDPQLEDGTIDTTPKAAPEDVHDRIASKADNKLTQEQLNALNEKNSIMRAEWEAKASLDTLNKAIADYKSYTLQNDKDKAQSEKDLISLNQRLVENIRNLKELAERWNFLDKYFQVGNEGVVFGEQNGNTCAKMSNDRFSIFSAGNEVMYISQGTLFIENGIFSKAIQIGRFREEQYHLNPDMNVIRYVGGV